MEGNPYGNHQERFLLWSLAAYTCSFALSEWTSQKNHYHIDLSVLAMACRVGGCHLGKWSFLCSALKLLLEKLSWYPDGDLYRLTSKLLDRKISHQSWSCKNVVFYQVQNARNWGFASSQLCLYLAARVPITQRLAAPSSIWCLLSCPYGKSSVSC